MTTSERPNLLKLHKTGPFQHILKVNGKKPTSLRPSIRRQSHSSKNGKYHVGRTPPRTLSTPLPAKSCCSWWFWDLLALLQWPLIPCYSHIRRELWFLTRLRFEFSNAGWYRRRNERCQILWQSVQGFRSSDTHNFAIVHIGTAGRPYNSVSTTVLHCDTATTTTTTTTATASMQSSLTRTRGRLLRRTWRHTHVRAFIFGSESIAVTLAAAVPEDAADLVLDVIEPVLLPAGAVLAVVSRQFTHVVRPRVIYIQHTNSLANDIVTNHSSVPDLPGQSLLNLKSGAKPNIQPARHA